MKTQKRKASGIYKLEPLFKDVENNTLVVDSKTTHYVNGTVSGYLVVSVPETTSRASAIELENQIQKVTKKPVLIVTHNISLLRATMLTGKERAELARIVEKAKRGETDGDTAQQGTCCERDPGACPDEDSDGAQGPN